MNNLAGSVNSTRITGKFEKCFYLPNIWVNMEIGGGGGNLPLFFD